MKIYWDTSAIVALSPEVYEKLRDSAGQITLSHLTELEVVCAMCRRSARPSQSKEKLLRAALSNLERIAKLNLGPRLDRLCSAARQLAMKHRLSSNDSLHLAAAVHIRDEAGAAVEMASYDNELRRAALAEGLTVFPA